MWFDFQGPGSSALFRVTLVLEEPWNLCNFQGHTSLPVDPLDMAPTHPRFPVQGHILSNGGEMLSTLAVILLSYSYFPHVMI